MLAQAKTQEEKKKVKLFLLKIENESKAMGKKKGVNDIFVYLPSCLLHIEFKVGKNKQQKEQVQFEKHISKFDYAKYYLVYSCEEAIKIIEEYL